MCYLHMLRRLLDLFSHLLTILSYTNFMNNRQLQSVAPNHSYLQDLDLKSSLFDRAAQRFAVA